MPRPTPIIIPGATGMGGSSKSSNTNLQLDKVAALFGFIQDRMAKAEAEKANEAAGSDMLKILGMDSKQVEQPAVPVSVQGTGAKALAQPSPVSSPDYSAMGKSEVGRNVLTDIIKGNMGSARGNASAPKVEHNIIGKDGKPHSWQILPNGTMKDLGLTFNQPKSTSYDPRDEVAEHIKKKYGMDALQEWVYRMQIASNPTAGIITPPEQVMKDIDEKYGKNKKPGKESKAFTPAMAGEYMKKYGSRAKAEEAAKKDGYTW